MTGKFPEWRIVPVDRYESAALARELRVPLAMASLLLGRGITDRQQANAYFAATLADLPSPFLMQGMEEAVAAVLAARQRNAPVLIYGDYDVDGATGSALLVLFFRRLGFAEVVACQSHRLREGYGLHPEVVRRAAPNFAGKAPLLITVDCGISCAEQVRALKQEGWTVVVTDHHRPPAILPAADAVLDPLQPGCGFPEKILAGVGVAFYLAIGLRSRLRDLVGSVGCDINLKEFLDLVAIGTVADLVPLTGVNRLLVKAGLEVLSRSGRPGIVELLRVCSVENGATSEDIAFRLAPRLNAAGRLGEAGRALDLLTSDDPAQAACLAGELHAENVRRKEMVEVIDRQAGQLAEQAVAAGRMGLVLAGERWHPGVIGIAAARVAERYRRPTLLFSVENGRARGSGRSVAGIDIHEILDETRGLFSEFGGHGAAVGMSMEGVHLDSLAQYFDQRVAGQLTEEMLRPRLGVDWSEDGGGIFEPAFLSLYQGMGPFGNGNPEPIFAANGEVLSAKVVGAQHLKLSMRFNGERLGGIGFGLADLLPMAVSGERLSAAFRLRLNTFNRKTEWQVEILDLAQPSY